jgi:hypothetical protein
MQREPDGLSRSRIQPQLGAAHHDTRAHESELGANQAPRSRPPAKRFR